MNRWIRRAWAWAALAVVVLLDAISYAPWKTDNHTRLFGDALNYYAMSEHTGAAVENPFALRMLTPWLVHRLQLLGGLSFDATWLLFTAAVLLVTLVVFLEFLWTGMGLSLYSSALATVALGCTFWFAPYALSNPYLVDPVNNLVLVLALWCVVAQRLLLFMLVLAIGVTNKETAVLFAPLYPIWTVAHRRTWRDREVALGVMAVVFVGCVYVVFRGWAQHLTGGDYSFGTGTASGAGTASGDGAAVTMWDNIRYALSRFQGSEHLAIFGTFGALWVLWLAWLHANYIAVPRRAMKDACGKYSSWIYVSLWLAACCLLGRLFATDTQRVFVMMFPVVFVALATIPLWRPTGDREWRIGAAVALYIATQLQWVTGPAALACAAGTLLLLANAHPARLVRIHHLEDDTPWATTRPPS